MKVIFLDFDGVLNSEEMFAAKTVNGTIYIPEEFPYSEICPNAINRLNHIIEQTGAVVCVSSTWRLGRKRTELQELLAHVGFKGTVIGKTPDFREGYPSRGKEIAAWLKQTLEAREIESFVILDDDDDMLPEQQANFVKTSFKKGLTDELAAKAIEILHLTA